MATISVVPAILEKSYSVKRIGPQPEDTLDRPGPGYGHPKNFDPPLPPSPPPPPPVWLRWFGRYLEQDIPPAPMQWEYDGFISTTDAMGNMYMDGTPAPGGTLTIGDFVITNFGANEAFELNTTSALASPPMPLIP